VERARARTEQDLIMKRTHLLSRVLRDCYCRLQPSHIHGIGVFAVRDIPNGRNPFKTIPKYTEFGYVRITEDELDALPPKLSQLIRELFIPTDGKMHVPNFGTNMIRLNCYLNHSAAPNMRTRNGYDFTTLRKILVGEELTVDYRTYGAEDLIAVR
jgi:SET domain-containing protein